MEEPSFPCLMAELRNISRATKEEGLYQGHTVTLWLNWDRASLKTFSSVLGGCCEVTVGRDLLCGPFTVALSFVTGERAQGIRTHVLKFDRPVLKSQL